MNNFRNNKRAQMCSTNFITKFSRKAAKTQRAPRIRFANIAPLRLCEKSFLVSSSAALLLCGCAGLHDPHYTPLAPEDKFTQIEAFKPQAHQTENPTNATPVPAELQLSLQQVRAMALKNNLNLQADLINPKQAAERVNAVEARKYEILFGAGITHSKTSNPQGSEHDTSMGLDLELPLPTGGELELGLNNEETITGGYNSDLDFSISQPLLKGAGRRDFMHAIRLAKYSWQKTSATTKLNIIDTLVSVDQAYWSLYKNHKTLEVRQQQYALAESLLEQTQRLVESGHNPQVDLIRSESGLAKQTSAIIAAENSLRKAVRNLKRLLNQPDLPLSGTTTLIPTTEPDPVQYALNSTTLTESALTNRMELLRLRIDQAKNTCTITHLKNRRLPDLGFRYSYGIDGFDTDRPGSLSNLPDRDYENHRFTLSIDYPLGHKAASADLRTELLEQQQLEILSENRERIIRKEVLDALDALETSWQQILANRQSAILAGRLYEAEQRQFEVALRTSTDVLEAQAEFADARRAEYTALANYQIALLELARATGTLLGAARIE